MINTLMKILGFKNMTSVDNQRAKIKMKTGATCVINGLDVAGNSITINGNQVFVDGVQIEIPEQKQISIVVNGECDRVDTTSGDVTVHGNTGDVKTMSGDVTLRTGSISGSVSTMSGDVTCGGGILGNVKTMSGDIKGK